MPTRLILAPPQFLGTLGVTTGGALTNSGNVVVTGATTLAAGSGNDIILDSAGNNFSTVSVASANNVTLRDTNALALGASTVSGNLNVTTNGALTQSGALTVTGATTLASGAANNITLNNAGNNFSTVGITSGNNVTLVDVDGLDLGTSTVSGTLGVTTGGALTQSGPLAVTGTTTLAAGSGNDITLRMEETTSAPWRSRAGETLLFRMPMPSTSALPRSSGTFNVTTDGAITDSGNVVVTGATTLGAGSGNDIILDSAGNNFSTVSVASANNVTLRDTNALDLSASTIAGTLNVTTNGALTQSGVLNVAGTTTLAVGAGNNITLTNGGNTFSTVAITSGRNVALTDADALDLGTSTISGTLGVTTGGALTNSGNVVVTGATTLAAGSGNDIILDSAGNNFSTVSVASANNVTLRDTNALALGASTVSGNLNVTTNGALTQSGALTVTGATTLASGAANNITLNNAGNNFSTVGITSGNNVTLVDVDGLDLGTSTVSGTLGVTTGGALTQSGPLAVTGTTTLAAGSGNDITLANGGNNFSTVAVTSGRNVALTDTDALNLGASTIAGNLNVTTSGAITDSGNVVVTGTTTLAAGAANDITLNSAGNNFSILGITSGRNVTLVDSNALDLGASSVSGNLSLTTGGAVTQSGALSVTGTTSLTASATNTDILLDTQANNFSGVLSFGGTLANFRDIGLRNTNTGATVPTLSGLTNLRNLTLSFDSAPVNLPTLTASGTLNVTAGGAITDSGNVIVTGATTLAAGANDITLDSAGNNFSTVAVNSGNNVTLRDANALDLGTSNVSGTLNITTAGAITDSGNIVVAGITTLAAGSGNDITLDSAGNNFSMLGVTSGRNVTLADVNALDLGTSTVSGTLNVTTNGALTQSGALNVTGTTTLSAGTANDITLDSAGNDFSTVAVTSGNNVALSDANALNLGASTVSGALNVTTGGTIGQTGALSVAGVTTLSAGSGDIVLNNPANDFSTLAISSGNNVTLVDSNALDLGGSTISGALNVATSGPLTQSGPLTVIGMTTLAAGAGNDITLNNPGNNFSTAAVASGNNITLADINGLDLGGSTVSGTLNITTGGALTQSGPLAVSGVTTLATGSGNDITLNNVANDFSSVTVASANNVTLADANGLDLGTSTVSGTLNVTTNGALTQSGALNVTGTTTLSSGSGNDITLTDAGNNFGTVAVANARNVALTDANALDLGASTISGTLDVSTGGAVTQSGALNVAGTATFAAGAGNDITLSNTANDLGSVGIVSGNNVTLADANSLNLAASTISGSLNVITGGAITQSGALAVTGARA